MKNRMFLVTALHGAVALLLVSQSASQNEGQRDIEFETQDLTQAEVIISPVFA